MVRACAAVVLCLLAAAASGAEPALAVKPHLEEMIRRKSQYDAADLDKLGPAGLAGVLDYLLPQSIAARAPPNADETRALVAQLGSEDFKTREKATDTLIAQRSRAQDIVAAAAKSDDPEVRMRAQRILRAWAEVEPFGETFETRTDPYQAALRVYFGGIRDAERLELLARRMHDALTHGVPKGDRIEVIRMGLSCVARGGDDRYCELLRPLLKHEDPEAPALAIRTIGGNLEGGKLYPRILIDALESERDEVVDAALSATPECRDPKRLPDVQKTLRRIFASRSEKLKFQACFPLMYCFQDQEAVAYLIQQTKSADPERAMSAVGWLGDACNWGKPITPEIKFALVPLLRSEDRLLRREAASSLLRYSGEEVVAVALPLLGELDTSLVERVASGLLEQRDKAQVKRLLAAAAEKHENDVVRMRAKALLGQLEKRDH